MRYARQSTSPEWFRSDNSKIYHSATSGSSPFNGWYEFDDRADAIEIFRTTFHSQSFHDNFTLAEGEVYDSDELGDLLNEQFGHDHDFSEVIDAADLSGIIPADLGDVINAESKF